MRTSTPATGTRLSGSWCHRAPAQHNPLLYRHRKARGHVVMTWLHANHSASPEEPPWRGGTGRWKKGFEPDGSARRRRGSRENERSAEAEVARQAYPFLKWVLRICPRENYGNFQPVALVFSRFHEGDSPSVIRLLDRVFAAHLVILH